MKCYKCGGHYQEKHDSYIWDDPFVGKLQIKGQLYYQCTKCEDILLSSEMASEIDKTARERRQALISQFPLSDFLSAKQTASLLGVTRQALNKNRRIKRGFIYQSSLDGVNYYLKQSVVQYQKSQDGRFLLDSESTANKRAFHSCSSGLKPRYEPVSFVSDG